MPPGHHYEDIKSCYSVNSDDFKVFMAPRTVYFYAKWSQNTELLKFLFLWLILFNFSLVELSTSFSPRFLLPICLPIGVAFLSSKLLKLIKLTELYREQCFILIFKPAIYWFQKNQKPVKMTDVQASSLVILLSTQWA